MFIFYETRLFTEKFSLTTTIHPDIFGKRALWADSGPLRMSTIAPRDQFKPIRIGENLVVNYKADSGPPRMNTIASQDQLKSIRVVENLVVNNKR